MPVSARRVGRCLHARDAKPTDAHTLLIFLAFPD